MNNRRVTGRLTDAEEADDDDDDQVEDEEDEKDEKGNRACLVKSIEPP